MEQPKVWTTETTNGNGVHPAQYAGNPYFIGVQSRFRRKYFHKTIFIILILIIILLIIGIIVVACYSKYVTPICETSECIRAAANLIETMDQTVDPCEDFYKFSCGNWAVEHPRPDSSSSYDWFAERQRRVLRNIRTFLSANTTEDNNLPIPVQQVKEMYAACMDTEKMDQLGLDPIVKYLKEYNLPEIPTYLNLTETDYNNYNFDWIKSLVKIKRSFGADLMIGFDIFPDPTNRSINRLGLGAPESGSELPFNTEIFPHYNHMKRKALGDEDSDDEKESESLIAYYAYVSEIIAVMVTNANPSIKIEMYADDIQKSAKQVVKMAKYIYKLSDKAENMTHTDETDTLEHIKNVHVDELQNITDSYIAPRKPIPIYRRYIELTFENITKSRFDIHNDKVLTSDSDIKYLELLVDYVSNTSLAEIEMYIWWTIVEELVLHTTSTIRELHHEYSKTVTSLEGSVARSLYCTGAVNQLMGMAVSYAIIDHNFLNVTKGKVEQMLRLIRESFDGLVEGTTWMDAETKRQTLEKSKSMKSLIGFPDWLMNKTKMEKFYSGLNVSRTTHLENMMGILKWRTTRMLNNLNQMNEFGWATAPTNVNAFHTFQANAITIPLAMLQYPFYHLGIEALNYGSIGTVLGHELTHGFDDAGRQFDKDGNMRQWWTNSTIKEYVNRTTCFINQYENYYLTEINDHINGKLTLGENIADNGGFREAYYGYQKYVKENGPEPLLPGLENYTHNQLFFISFGNLWCESQTVQAIKWAIEDSHCPGRIRLKGVLQNSHEFSKAFNCKQGSGMYPTTDRCRIW